MSSLSLHNWQTYFEVLDHTLQFNEILLYQDFLFIRRSSCLTMSKKYHYDSLWCVERLIDYIGAMTSFLGCWYNLRPSLSLYVDLEPDWVEERLRRLQLYNFANYKKFSRQEAIDYERKNVFVGTFRRLLRPLSDYFFASAQDWKKMPFHIKRHCTHRRLQYRSSVAPAVMCRILFYPGGGNLWHFYVPRGLVNCLSNVFLLIVNFSLCATNAGVTDPIQQTSVMNERVLTVGILSPVWVTPYLLGSIALIGPAFDSALEDIVEGYPMLNVTQQRIPSIGFNTCLEWAPMSVDRLAEYYYRRRKFVPDVTVIILAGKAAYVCTIWPSNSSILIFAGCNEGPGMWLFM